jgi:hypothetical protein
MIKRRSITDIFFGRTKKFLYANIIELQQCPHCIPDQTNKSFRIFFFNKMLEFRFPVFDTLPRRYYIENMDSEYQFPHNF